MSGIRVTRSLVIPETEIDYRFTPSGGPGGQHANKASTRVELIWDVANSSVLGPRQRDRIMRHLRNRIDGSGVLHLSSDRRRSQTRNREDVTERLVSLLRQALTPTKRRLATEPSRAAREKRLEAKRRRSAIKKARRVDPRDL